MIRPHRATLLLLLIIAVLHIIVGGQLGLTVDGAHYALYGKFLAWSYFDHPPMVGWLQALVEHFSHSNLAMRIVPTILMFLWPCVLFNLVRKLFPNETPWLGFIAVLFTQLASIIYILGLAYTPQAPLLLFAILGLYYLWQSIHTERLWHWVLMGLFFGLAGLSDYTAVFLIITAILFALLQKPHAFLRRGPWLAMLVAAIVSSPVFLWNAAHHWASIHYQLHHGFHASHWKLSRFGASLAFQFAAYTPFLFLFGYYLLIKQLKSWRQANIQFLLLIALPIFLLYDISSGWNKVLPHWPVLAWVAVAVLAAHYIVTHWHQLRVRIITRVSLIYGLLMLLALTSVALYQYLPIPYTKNPLRDLYGWHVAALIGEAQLTHVPHHYGVAPALLVNNWTLASRIAWYSNHPVQVVNPSPALNQFDFWFGYPTKTTYGIVVLPAGWHLYLHAGKPGYFAHCHKLSTLTIHRYDKRVNQFTYYYCYGYTPSH